MFVSSCVRDTAAGSGWLLVSTAGVIESVGVEEPLVGSAVMVVVVVETLLADYMPAAVEPPSSRNRSSSNIAPMLRQLQLTTVAASFQIVGTVVRKDFLFLLMQGIATTTTTHLEHVLAPCAHQVKWPIVERVVLWLLSVLLLTLHVLLQATVTLPQHAMLRTEMTHQPFRRRKDSQTVQTDVLSVHLAHMQKQIPVLVIDHPSRPTRPPPSLHCRGSFPQTIHDRNRMLERMLAEELAVVPVPGCRLSHVAPAERVTAHDEDDEEDDEEELSDELEPPLLLLLFPSRSSHPSSSPCGASSCRSRSSSSFSSSSFGTRGVIGRPNSSWCSSDTFSESDDLPESIELLR
uniref:Uncharacterized protein n=1 Tax=Anopheles farauti TaxID=69004 RepID=A0A182QQ29_9DIPT